MADGRGDNVLERLVADHHQAVYRYAYRLTGAAADAEDLTQQTFLIALERREQLRRPESARAWLFAVLRNCFLKAWNRPGAVPASVVGIDLDQMPIETPEGPAVDPVRLQEALDELPAAYRAVVVMYYFDDCSYRKIAEEMGIPLGTVMSRLARAKGHLRARLIQPEPPLAGSVRKG